MSRNKLLLVEDNISDIELVRISLRDFPEPVEVSCFRDGLELMQYLESSHPDDIGVILMDLNMPRMNGLEVLRHMQANSTLRKLPVIIFTTSANEQDIATSYELGARAYLCKPIDYGEFFNTITSIIRFWIGTPIVAA